MPAKKQVVPTMSMAEMMDIIDSMEMGDIQAIRWPLDKPVKSEDGQEAL